MQGACKSVKVMIKTNISNLDLFRSNDDGPTLACFERDDTAVDTREIFENHCEDIHGNKYEELSETSSCCECLMLVI